MHRTSTVAEYDYIIVGSGSAGGFLAYRLSENGHFRILLLEAGPTDAHWTTRVPAGSRYTFSGGRRNWCFETEPEPFMANRVLSQPRGKTVGGSSSLNGMVLVRGHRRDFDRWAEDGATGWRFDDVLPHFRSIETYHGSANGFRGDSGPITVQKMTDNHPVEEAFIDAGIQAGHANPDDYNGVSQEGVSAFDANCFGGWRSGTARECVWPAARRRNVTVTTNAHVTKVLVENRRATGVAYRHKGQDRTAHADREVILSAGAFQSPQLLMLSGIGPADHLREFGIGVVQDLPGVGQNLQDHLEVHVMYSCPHRGMTKNKLLAWPRIAMAGAEWMLFRTGPAATSHSRVGAFFRSDASVAQPDIQFHFWPYFMDGWSPPPEKDGYCFDVGPVRSDSRGWVKLGSADPFAPPRILLKGLSTESDRSLFRTAMQFARDIAAQPAFDFCRGPEVSPGADVRTESELDEYVRNNANSAFHPCGTARMGNDAMAVTDPEARVHGIEKLRVADASIMPTITNGNINAPSMMIGEKVAHMILESSS